MRRLFAVVFGLASFAGACAFADATAFPHLGYPFQDFVQDAKGAQSLYVYDTGVPGEIPGQYARYSVPGLVLQEATVADGLGSPVAFGKGDKPFFADEATAGFAIYEIPSGMKAQPGIEQFSGIPCSVSSLATAPNGDYFVVQYCSGSVLEYSAKAVKGGGSKNPIATYTGGQFGGSGQPGPTYAVVDKKGGLYVGDYAGGVTYFAKGSTKPVIAFPTGAGGEVYQMIADDKGDVWSIHGPNPTNVYFQSETACVLDPSGSVVRNELAERFSGGVLVQQLYTGTTDGPDFGDDGISIAVDSSLRVYAGVGSPTSSYVLDYDPGKSCPNDSLALAGAHGANPQVTVDAQKNFYVTDYVNNTISSYKSAGTKAQRTITQGNGLVNIEYAALH